MLSLIVKLRDNNDKKFYQFYHKILSLILLGSKQLVFQYLYYEVKKEINIWKSKHTK